MIAALDNNNNGPIKTYLSHYIKAHVNNKVLLIPQRLCVTVGPDVTEKSLKRMSEGACNRSF